MTVNPRRVKRAKLPLRAGGGAPPKEAHKIAVYDRDAHIQLLRSLWALSDLRFAVLERIPLVFYAKKARHTNLPSTDDLLSDISVLAEKAGVDFTVISDDLHQFLKEQAEDKPETKSRRPRNQSKYAKGERPHQDTQQFVAKPQSESHHALRSALHKRYENLLFELGSIRPSPEKALTYLEVEITQLKEPSPEALSTFGPDDRQRFRNAVDQLREHLFTGEHYAPPGHLQDEWNAALLRYYEDFEPNDAKSFIREVASTAVADATYGSSLLANATERETPPWELQRFLYSCWIYTRSRTWRYLFSSTATRVKDIVLSWQRPSGAWADYVPREHDGRSENELPRLAESASTTAYAMHFLSRYGTDERDHRAVDNGARWLLGNADRGGGWRSVRMKPEEPGIITTIAVLEALRRSGVPLDHPVVRQGEEALLRWQDAPGAWSVEGIWDAFPTAWAIEYFRSRTQRGELPNGFLLSAKRFLMKSEELFITNDQTNGNLALVAAYHGLEHFLYGSLLQIDSNAKISGDDGKTIGFREGLTQFRTLARKKGWISDAGGLPQETQLRELAASRDLLVHRGQQSAPKDVEQRLMAARRFVLHFDINVLGFRLLD